MDSKNLELKHDGDFMSNVITQLYDMVLNGDHEPSCPPDAHCPICSFISSGLADRKRLLEQATKEDRETP